MSNHANQAVSMLEKIGKKPIGAMNYLRDDDELGSVPAGILPDDDMVLDLVICQTKTVRGAIHLERTPKRSPLLVCRSSSRHATTTCFDVLGIYAGACESTEEDGNGIAHAASWAYDKLGDKKAAQTGLFRRPAARLQGHVLAAHEGASSFTRDREGASWQRE